MELIWIFNLKWMEIWEHILTRCQTLLVVFDMNSAFLPIMSTLIKTNKILASFTILQILLFFHPCVILYLHVLIQANEYNNTIPLPLLFDNMKYNTIIFIPQRIWLKLLIICVIEKEMPSPWKQWQIIMPHVHACYCEIWKKEKQLDTANWARRAFLRTCPQQLVLSFQVNYDSEMLIRTMQPK